MVDWRFVQPHTGVRFSHEPHGLEFETINYLLDRTGSWLLVWKKQQINMDIEVDKDLPLDWIAIPLAILFVVLVVPIFLLAYTLDVLKGLFKK